MFKEADAALGSFQTTGVKQRQPISVTYDHYLKDDASYD